MDSPSGIKTDRRLAAILAADIAGYSSLMGSDEERTVRDLKAHQAVVLPMISSHGGRVIDTAGDGILAEFASVMNAVRCAIDFQETMAKRNGAHQQDQQMHFRIGINVGDVVFDETRLYGDGINIAARLEGLSEPGGICVSGKVHDEVKGKLEVTFEDLGNRTLKNIAEPVRVYRVHKGAIFARKQRRLALGRSACIGVVVAGALALTIGVGFQKLSPFRTADNKAVPPLSMVVLPFTNLTGDAGQEYLADGITQDLTTDLSRISGSFVIARNTAFTFKGKAIDVKSVGRDLGVRYALEGSVRSIGDQIRVNAQLIETSTGASIWGDRIDVDRKKLTDLQDDFTSRLARVLNVELINAEGRRPPTANPDAVDLTMRAWAILNGQHTRENLERAVSFLDDALRIDANHTEALIGLAHALTRVFYARFATDPKAVLARADDAASRALTLVPNNARAHYAKGEVLQVRKQFEAALAEYKAATSLNPNLAAAYGSMGRTVLLAGRSHETFPLVEKAIRLSPRDPLLFDWYFLMCHAHSHLGNYDPAIEWCRKSAAVGSLWMTHVDLISAFGWKGQLAEAKAEMANLEKLMPKYTVKKWADRGPSMSENPTFSMEYARIVEGLRKAGLPEE